MKLNLFLACLVVLTTSLVSWAATCPTAVKPLVQTGNCVMGWGGNTGLCTSGGTDEVFAGGCKMPPGQSAKKCMPMSPTGPYQPGGLDSPVDVTYKVYTCNSLHICSSSNATVSVGTGNYYGICGE
jgi:hypothetical protein